MRVLVLTNMYPPHYYGGYELVCRDVVDRFRESGHQVHVLTTTMRIAGVGDGGSIGVQRDLRFAWRDHVLQSPSLPRRFANERHNQRVLREALRAFAPDVASVWNMGAMSLGLLETLRRCDVPAVLNVCDDWLIYGVDLDPWARLFARRSATIARAAAGVTRLPCGLPDLSSATALFISDFTRTRAAEHSRMPLGRSTTTWAGIDERVFPVTTDAATHGWRWRLLGVGRIDARKGIEVAIRALAQLPDTATLTWSGHGDEAERARLNDVADELGVRDRLRWHVGTRNDLPALYKDADAFVFPSTWSEPLGLVPLEAMACGLPVVASGTGGSAEFLHDQHSALVPERVGDPTALADAVRRLADDEELRRRLIGAGSRIAAELTIGRLAATLEDWHQAAANRFRDGAPNERKLVVA